MHQKKHLNFGSLIASFREKISKFSDPRQQSGDYSLSDVVLSGFACMFFQDSSLLQFQRRMQEEQERNNFSSLFGVKDIPESTQLREVLDSLPSSSFSPVFKELLHRLQRGKHLEQYQFYRGSYLLPIDGTQYFSSQKLSCKHCLHKEHRSGEVTFSHQALQAAIVHPELRQVLPLMVEDIRNEDGETKQDCESNAGKRLLSRFRSEHPQLDVIVLGDALFSKQPMIEHVAQQGMSYIFGVKPGGNKGLFAYLAEVGELDELRLESADGKVQLYRWMNEVPLSAREDARSVNFFEFQILAPGKDGQMKTNFRSSWVTNIPLSKHSVERMVRAARCRWKIENECFNNLKNQGYHLEHNFGHGEQHLSFNFYLLTVLAFFFHQIFELTDRQFQQCREKFGSKRFLWERLRSAIHWFVFESWQQLLEFVLQPEKFTVSSQAP